MFPLQRRHAASRWSLPPDVPFVRMSPSSVIPKVSMGEPVVPIKWRVFFNLSWGKKWKESVNCGIETGRMEMIKLRHATRWQKQH